MAQPTAGDYTNLMNNLDVHLSSAFIESSSLTTEEINDPVRYDYCAEDSFYEMDLIDLHTLSPDQALNDLMNHMQSNEEFVASSPTTDMFDEILSSGSVELHSIEPTDSADPIQSTDEQLAMIKSGNPSLPVIRSYIEKSPIKSVNDSAISLSSSVAVTNPTNPTNPLQLVHGIEDTYRPRYKSDYFPQRGEPRRPRYVADGQGNHSITLQMPAGYNRDLKNEYIRIGLITTSIDNHGHFYSPYKFQTDNRHAKISDQNPMYLPVQAHRGNGSTLKLHLVLIKSKLDQLNDAQPLKPFLDTIGSVQNIIREEKLSPKELINKYQLEKSHIAFTLCTRLSDGTYEIHPQTTITSSVITEVPPKQSKTSKNKSETIEANTGKQISCPNCAHCFDITDGTITEKGNKRKSTARTPRANTKSTTNTRANKKKKTA